MTEAATWADTGRCLVCRRRSLTAVCRICVRGPNAGERCVACGHGGAGLLCGTCAAELDLERRRLQRRLRIAEGRADELEVALDNGAGPPPDKLGRYLGDQVRDARQLVRRLRRRLREVVRLLDAAGEVDARVRTALPLPRRPAEPGRDS